MSPAILAFPLALLGAFLYWRYVWFFRNPPRKPPSGENIVSPADGTVVYVTLVNPHDDVITIKQGVRAKITDILREDLESSNVHIGIFMSPFHVHYNRIPLSGRVEFIKHHPALLKNHHMAPMHWRTILRRPPLYKNSMHIMCNERTVTKLKSRVKGEIIPYYVVQIAGKSVKGIESYISEGTELISC